MLLRNINCYHYTSNLKWNVWICSYTIKQSIFLTTNLDISCEKFTNFKLQFIYWSLYFHVSNYTTLGFLCESPFPQTFCYYCGRNCQREKYLLKVAVSKCWSPNFFCSKILRNATGYSWIDWKWNKEMRETCEVQNVVLWIK